MNITVKMPHTFFFSCMRMPGTSNPQMDRILSRQLHQIAWLARSNALGSCSIQVQIQKEAQNVSENTEVLFHSFSCPPDMPDGQITELLKTLAGCMNITVLSVRCGYHGTFAYSPMLPLHNSMEALRPQNVGGYIYSGYDMESGTGEVHGFIVNDRAVIEIP